MALLIRRAGRRDLDAIHAHWEKLRELDAKADERLTPAKTASRMVQAHREAVLADPRTAFFVAESQGQVVGFLHAQIDQNDPIYEPARYGLIVDLFVAEGHRRDRVGSRLLDYTKEWFRSNGLSEYRVAAPVRNPDAQRFFEHAGARPVAVTLTASLTDAATPDDR